MNLKLHTVISDILGKTGMQIVRAIIEGERDANVLTQFKDPRVKADDATIRPSDHIAAKTENILALCLF